MNGVSIIIPSRGTSRSLYKLLASIANQKLTKPIEVLVLFNLIELGPFKLLANKLKKHFPTKDGFWTQMATKTRCRIKFHWAINVKSAKTSCFLLIWCTTEGRIYSVSATWTQRRNTQLTPTTWWSGRKHRQMPRAQSLSRTIRQLSMAKSSFILL